MNGVVYQCTTEISFIVADSLMYWYMVELLNKFVMLEILNRFIYPFSTMVSYVINGMFTRCWKQQLSDVTLSLYQPLYGT